MILEEKKSVVNTHDFQNLLIEEHGKEEKKKYDLDININFNNLIWICKLLKFILIFVVIL